MTQRITNDHKETLFESMTAFNVPVVLDGPDLFVLGPHIADGTYALGAREGDEWVVRCYVPADDPRIQLILMLIDLERSLNAGPDDDGPFAEEW